MGDRSARPPAVASVYVAEVGGAGFKRPITRKTMRWPEGVAGGAQPDGDVLDHSVGVGSLPSVSLEPTVQETMG